MDRSLLRATNETPDNAEINIQGTHISTSGSAIRRWEHNSDQDFSGYAEADYHIETDDNKWDFSLGGMFRDKKTQKADSERDDMQKRVDTILRHHNVDFYVCGHIHNFQHIKIPRSNIDYVVNSSASLSRPEVDKIEGSRFCSGEPGFSILCADKNSLTLNMINKEGKVIHAIRRTK